MKVFISFDFEGIGGISSFSEMNDKTYWNREATNQILEFCEGIRESAADICITICDSHARGENIIWDMLPDYIGLIKGYPRRKYMVEGLNSSYTHFVLFGYHTAVGSEGVMDHTYSGGSIAEIKVNDFVVDEGVINASYAGELNVPLSMILGDDKTIEFYQKNFDLDKVETVISKKAISRFAAKMLPKPLLYKKLKAAGKNIVNQKGLLIENIKQPLSAEITLKDTTKAYLAESIPGVERTSGTTISFEAENWVNFYNYLMTIVHITRVSDSLG